MKWPSDFPKACPPKDAKPRLIRVYILVHSPIRASDFDSLKKRNPTISFSSPELECQAHGLSLFENFNDINRVRRRVRRLRHHLIAAGVLTRDKGVVKPTSSQFGDSHRTWWIPVGLKPWESFQIIEEELQ